MVRSNKMIDNDTALDFGKTFVGISIDTDQIYMGFDIADTPEKEQIYAHYIRRSNDNLD